MDVYGNFLIFKPSNLSPSISSRQFEQQYSDDASVFLAANNMMHYLHWSIYKNRHLFCLVKNINPIRPFHFWISTRHHDEPSILGDVATEGVEATGALMNGHIERVDWKTPRRLNLNYEGLENDFSFSNR